MLLKLIIAPLLILLITCAQKRFGSFVSGIIPGLPITSGPISYFIALEQGKLFAANSAVASLYGMSGIGLFCFSYLVVSRRFGMLKSLFTALSIWCVFSVITLFLPVNIIVASVVSLCILLGLTIISTKLNISVDAKPLNARWELPVKMILVTSFIVLVTFISQHIGSAWSGLISTFPVILAVMGSVAHFSDKQASTFKILNGGIIGSLGGCVFFAVIAFMLKHNFMIWQVYATAAIFSTLFTIIFSQLINRQLTKQAMLNTKKAVLKIDSLG
ncbi:hypothetical protein [Pseudoalteromonas arctica]|uniref:hypothetical protein n=1 Tax=Pseudoalteromonas arctica TaxID=394751 RepID=UPI002494C5D8|nr:hypothetical protein [Pseudoalteromonas arctica]